MTAMLRDSVVVVVVVVVVVRTRPRAIPLATITTKKSLHGFRVIFVLVSFPRPRELLKTFAKSEF